MSEIIVRSHMTSEPIGGYGGDWLFVDAARVSSKHGEGSGPREIDTMKDRGLIEALIRQRHGSPFKHGLLVFYVEAPIFVFRELRTHWVNIYQIELGSGEEGGFRFRESFEDLNYSEASGRYRAFSPEFWIPEMDRPMFKGEKFSPMAPKMEPAPDFGTYQSVVTRLVETYQREWDNYQVLLTQGVAPEVARAALGISVYSAMYMSMNPLAAMRLMTLRVASPDAKYPTYPQLETQRVVEPIEAYFAENFPVTYASFVANGRVAP